MQKTTVLGRPKLEITRRIERDLATNGQARAGYGGALGVTEYNARMRLYNSAKRVGVKVRTERVNNGRGRYILGVVLND